MQTPRGLREAGSETTPRGLREAGSKSWERSGCRFDGIEQVATVGISF